MNAAPELTEQPHIDGGDPGTQRADPLLDRAHLRRRARVLIIEPQNRGGMWHYAVSLSKALAEAEFEPVLATIFPFEPLRGSEGLQLCPIGTDLTSTASRPTRFLRRMFCHLDKLNRLRRTILRFRPDIVHIHNPLGTFDFVYFRLLKAWTGGVVYTAHDARSLHRRDSWFDWARYRAADAILVHSSRDVRALVSSGIDESKITAVPHGNYVEYCVDPNPSREHAKRMLGLPPGARAILFFGAISPYKGLDLLIEAFSRLSRDDPNTYLIVAGSPSEDFAPYRRLIQKLSLADRVLLDLRYIPFAEFPRYFSAADLVAFPYRRISQSGVLQLAYAYGRPVVVTDVGGLAEAVGQDRTGLIVETPDPEAFSAAIRKLLADPEEATRMGNRGRVLATTKYSWSAIVEKIAQVYQSVHPITV